MEGDNAITLIHKLNFASQIKCKFPWLLGGSVMIIKIFHVLIEIMTKPQVVVGNDLKKREHAATWPS